MAVDTDVRLVCNFKSQGVPGPEARRRAVRRRSARCTDGRRPVSSGDRARRAKAARRDSVLVLRRARGSRSPTLADGGHWWPRCSMPQMCGAQETKTYRVNGDILDVISKYYS